MPLYDYYCEANDRTIEVEHPMSVKLRTWGEVCYVAQISLGETDPLAPVRKKISAPHLATPIGNSELKQTGFTKLVKRDTGVYENVTAGDTEKRYVRSDDPGSVPDLRKKIRD